MCNMQLDIQANLQKERDGLEIETWCLPYCTDKSKEIVQGVKGENVEGALRSTGEHLHYKGGCHRKDTFCKRD